MWGLPSTWMSPDERLSDVGTSSRATPREAATYPGPPSWILRLAARSRSAGTQSSRSSPVVTKRSASRRSETKLGFGWTK